MPKHELTIKVFLLLILADFLETFHQFCFKKSTFPGSDPNIAGVYDVLVFFEGVFTSPFFWMGLFSLIAMFIIWSTILSRIDLSVAVPIASFSYILVAVASILFLHETITPLRWLGIVLILTGVIVVSMSSQERDSALR